MKKLILLPLLLITLTSCNSKVVHEHNIVDKVKIVSNNASDYQLVIANTQNEYVNLAVNEFATMIEKATGATFEIIDESTKSINSSLPYVSFGKTSLSGDISMPMEYDYRNSGYYLKNKNQNVYILADENYNQEGVLYGAYRLLEILVDYKAYSDDEIYVKESDDVYLPKIDESYIPSFDERELGYKELITNKTLASRLRLFNKETDNRWALHGHTSTNKYHQLLNQEVYHDAHPNWYADASSDGFYQLCYTAHGNEEEYKAMVNQMAENLYNNYIVKNPTAKYFMIGQEDNRAFCTCEACQQKSKAYDSDGKVSGLIVLFLNDVIEKVENIMKENSDNVNLNRDIKYVFFGYYQSIKPFDSKKIIPNKKLYIEFAPIELDFSKDFSHGATNTEICSCLEKWDAILDGRIIVYSYDVNYKNFLMNFNNFGSFKSYLLEYKKHHVNYFYSQGAVVNNVTGLTNMRLFVESQLLWNIEQNYEDLVHEFMEHYYKDASKSLELYYRITRDRYTYYLNANQVACGIKSEIVDNLDCWNKPTVDALHNALSDALKAIEKYLSSDEELYTKLYYRIKREMITTYYLYINYYSDFFSQTALEEMKTDFNNLVEYFKLTKVSEDGSGIGF